MIERSYPHYAIWKDFISGYWEIVRYDGPKRLSIVQTNIRTPDKADIALADWRRRSGERDVK